MEDDKLRELFKGFQPELPSEGLFMSRLQRSIEAVEIVKQQNARQHRRSRIAVVVAALSGFVSGVVLTLLFPLISEWLSSLTFSLPALGVPALSIDGPTVSWLLIGGACVTIVLNAYDLTLSRLTPK